ncbi:MULTISPECIES: ABC transporter ATP-binding protein [Nostocales]|uniref:ABC transporter ATP-binding protein n=1 Tax=Dolichospermum flos-aquae UHCC 0037 TaxID=2590026 RepID=A0ACC7S9P8_DOLFA|nr:MULTISPECIES: ABC transporter ATP-binding protein [Nostocales]MBO1066294.1 ABC transporter ATP-binding protein [Anabaena sp. 54]MTJ44736.1 ABC transporter ATP-binding protein [Dolichospermum flos-aquae UHCC 0037]
MSDTVIRVENLGKKYIIGHQQQERYTALRDVITNKVKSLSSLINSQAKKENPAFEEFWALKDVSFEIKQGDRVGIIGRNGAGKSTLLKILSRITEPTTGSIKIKGRVASLLEVGTGFHPELTGRENIFLNGAILGMGKEEIKRKFDEIVAFAEVEKFLDTPVKRYSSGMYVRLAFAVAAHLEPEILIVDEVLAVGDAQFQKKCLGKMEDVAGKEGKTVLFVSHNMAAISSLCSKALVLKTGIVEFPLGTVNNAINKYLMQVNQISKPNLSERKDRRGEGKIRIMRLGFFDAQGNELNYLVSGQSVEFRIFYESQEETLKKVHAGISISSVNGTLITFLSNQIAAQVFETISKKGFISCIIKKLPLGSGNYIINLLIRENNIIQDWIQEAICLTVEDGDFYGTGRIPPSSHSGIFIEQEWLQVNS